jgi:hypothetical protein
MVAGQESVPAVGVEQVDPSRATHRAAVTKPVVWVGWRSKYCGEIVTTVEQLEVEVCGPERRTCTVCQVGGNCDLRLRG